MLIGEIGGAAEEEAAELLARGHESQARRRLHRRRDRPSGRRMGHAGAIISGGKGTATGKIGALEEAGVTVVRSPAQMGAAMKKLMGGKPPLAERDQVGAGG